MEDVKHVTIGDVLTPWLGEHPDVDEWTQLGSPEMWGLCHEAYGFKLFADMGYGRLAITAGDYVVIDAGKDFVSCCNMLIVGLGEYYGVEKPTLYRRAGVSDEVIPVLAGASDGGH